ncbi:MAG: cofactor-independent phosphoglycerate mutase [Deferribacteraceae bacterium]|jgi:2,3-bisphosphoglycerate-independent phosphoglycerate mutase|nr:cofactor-independent phosphoglycerate mutase [Deferribacteraceae bacterium]
MKYLVLLCDGASDEKIPSLADKSIFEYANTPNLDKLAQRGVCGLVRTTPKGFSPGSDICNLSVMGYDPKRYYSGRSPLEAASKGIELGENDTAFRCNLVSIAEDDGSYYMQDFSAHHISNELAALAVKRLSTLFAKDGIEFYQGLSYRNLMIIRDSIQAQTTPPHDITGERIDDYLPSGEDGLFLRGIMQKAIEIFDETVLPANSIWLWGGGKRPNIPAFKELYGLSGGIVAAVDLLKGIGKYAGFKYIDVPGITGYIDTNFAGKAEYGAKALKDLDYLFIHVEAADEAGHAGNIEDKVCALENIDSKMIPIIMEILPSYKDFRILVMPDHATPVHLKTHTAEPVPALIYGTGVTSDANRSFSEFIKPSFILDEGYKIAELFFRPEITC